MKNVIQAYQGQPFSVTLESMLSSTNCGWCLMSMSEHVVLSGQTNVPVSPGIAPVNQNFHFIAIDGCLTPDEVILKFGLFNFSQVCSTPIRIVEFKVNTIPLVTNDAANACGGWTPIRKLTEEDLQVFNEAMEGFVGVGYTPLNVQSQLVKGVNYRFLCNATTVTREPKTFQAMVTVYKPLPGEGKAHITAITSLGDELSNCKDAAAVVHLDDLKVNTHDTLKQFIATLAGCKLEKGTYFSGTVYMKDLPTGLVQAEVQGVVGYIIGDMLLDMTLTSTDKSTRWTCTYRTGHGIPEWVERK
ncbi:hypothetical protein [Bacteroides timonensis]|uniref:hypothetical protein n=1 Tax=Bacteroides timonensis TaxID=1470345 RepID=UPI0004AF0A14|nr:hypothetical protein [Bacteroides timonensis]